MRVVFSDRYRIDIGRHVFPTAKYPRVHQALLRHGVVRPPDVDPPAPAAWDELALVHTAPYLRKLRHGGLSVTELARLEIPWSPGITDRFRLMTGGTVTAARHALRDGCAVHLGGGFHHAFAGHGEGFCMFNDVALAIRRLVRESAVTRVAVVDCDVHHGNGTASLFAGEPTVFTCSLHQADNYPLDKPPSTLDVPLADGTGDREYLAALEGALAAVMTHRPDLVCYLAGADPYEHDQLGGLALTKTGLRARDRLVLETTRRAGVPVVVTLAGGYATVLDDTVEIHVATVEEALALG